jgi:RimJ/RimL family protein N-acetyltransferase
VASSVPAIRLELLSEAHLQALEEMLTDEGVLRFTRVPEPVPPEFARTWFASYEEGRRDGTREAFAIVEAQESRFLGLGLAPRIDREEQTVELGYLVAPSARGRGVASEALRLLTAWAFADLDALRIELWIDVVNEPSKRVAEHSGYVREGVLRSVYFKQGRRHDFEIWSRLPTDGIAV